MRKPNLLAVPSALSILFLFALPVCNLAQTSDLMTNQRVIQLVQSGVHVDELSRMIRTAPAVSFDLNPADTDQLLRAGVSEETIKMMAARKNGSDPLQARLSALTSTGLAPSLTTRMHGRQEPRKQTIH